MPDSYEIVGDHSDMIYAAPNRRRGNGFGAGPPSLPGAGGAGGGDDDDFEDPADEDTRDMIRLEIDKLSGIVDRQLRMSDEANTRTLQALDAMREAQEANAAAIAAALVKAEEVRAAARATEKGSELEARWREAKLAGAIAIVLVIGLITIAGVQVSGNHGDDSLTAGRHATP